jgi:hypothetical protein
METSKTKLGMDHPHTLTTMANLALTYKDQGRWNEAELLNVQVIGMSKAKLGEDHPQTLTRMNNLALIYRDQGRWDEAVQVTEKCKTKLAMDHPDALRFTANLEIIQREGRRNGAFGWAPRNLARIFSRLLS